MPSGPAVGTRGNEKGCNSGRTSDCAKNCNSFGYGRLRKKLQQLRLRATATLTADFDLDLTPLGPKRKLKPISGG
jgi:hypothetical protein